MISVPSDQTVILLLSLLETHSDLNSSGEDESSKDAPVSLWSTHANKGGVLLSAEPVHIS